MVMGIKLECGDYGFECSFAVDGNGAELVKQLKQHFEGEHGIDYDDAAIIQMIVNRGYSLDTFIRV